MESGTAFPVNLSCEFFLWGLCSCMEESVLVGGKCPCRREVCLSEWWNCTCSEGIVPARMELYLLGRNCACPGNRVPRDSLFLIFVGSVNSLSGHLTPRRFRFFNPTLLLLFISRGVRNFSVHKFDPTLLPFFISRGVRNFSVHKFDPTLLPFFISRGAHSFSVHKFDPTRFPFFNSRGAPPHEKESFPFSWGQMLHFHKFPPDKNPRKHHASPEKASAHRSRGF